MSARLIVTPEDSDRNVSVYTVKNDFVLLGCEGPPRLLPVIDNPDLFGSIGEIQVEFPAQSSPGDRISIAIMGEPTKYFVSRR